jgi:methylmalonyl-CoA mutase N-terminal domain/subunit
VALRTQQILAHESGAANTIDPLGGSFFLEHLTDRIEKEAAGYIDRIDAMGGVVAAIESGFVQRQIEQAAYEYGQSVENRSRVIVGVNEFTSGTEPEMEIFEVPEEVRTRQIAKLNKVRQRRDAAEVKRALDTLRQAAAQPKAGLMPPILDAVRAYASVGEICGVLREVFGEYQESFSL